MKKHLIILLSLLICKLLTSFPVKAQFGSPYGWDHLYPKSTNVNDSLHEYTDSDALIQKSIVSGFKVEENLDEKPIQKSNSYVPNSVTIDKTKAVGDIPIQSGISSTGAVTYTVPIEVYPGIHGMQPQLSIAYNSMASNGLLGIGWNISGLSSIVRAPLSYYFDGKAEPINMNSLDAFYLDGVRLIKQNQTTTQIKYESEQGNIKVTANLNGTVVKYFNVFYPNGTKGIYGYTSNTGTNYLEYPMTSLSDLYGNTITYTYTFANNHHQISSISYANASVEFGYEARPDTVLSYTAGLKVKEDQRLHTIICKYGNSTLQTYGLSYTLQRNTSILTTITYSGSNGTSFNPLKFYYGENNTASSYDQSEATIASGYYSFTSPGLVKVAKGKFDYNTGDDALIVFSNKNPYHRPIDYHLFDDMIYGGGIDLEYDYFINDYVGNETIYFYTGLKSSSSLLPYSITTGTGFIDIFCTNLDGQGGDEIVKVNNTVSGNYDRVVFTVYAKSNTFDLVQKYTRTFDFPTILISSFGNKSVQPKYYYTGDFNGDGKMEVLAVSCHNPFGNTSRPTMYYLFDLEGNKLLYQGSAYPYQVTFEGLQFNASDAYDNTDRLFVGDFDGDGKSEICLVNTSGTQVLKFSVSGSTYSMSSYPVYTGLKRDDLLNRSLLLGEFNGDGEPDFLLSPPTTNINDSDWSLFYSIGDGQFDKTRNIVTNNRPGTCFFLQDVNGDGRSDLIKLYENYLMTFRSENNALDCILGYTSTNITENSVIVPFDLNGWNYNNQLITLKDNKITKYAYTRNDTKERLLTGMVTGMGVVNKNNYQMLNDSYPFYTQGCCATYPYDNFTGPIFVTESTEQYLNGQQIESQRYQYTNAVVHKQGRGFCGFEKISTYDNVRGRTDIQKFDPYNFGVLKEDDSPTAKIINTYSFDLASNKIAKVRLTNQSIQDKLKGISATSAYTYDTYGNPLTETINYGGNITESVSSNYYNNANESAYLLGFLIDRTKTTTRSGATWSERYYIPAYSKGQPNVIILYANGNQTSQETFSYNSQGLAVSHGEKPYTSANTLTTTYAYDSYGRKTKETDPLGFNTSYEYNTSDGSLYQVKNHKGQAVTYGYDSFFRIVSYLYPEGTQGTTEYSWNAAGTNGLYCIYRWEAGKPWTKTYYDAFDRETASSGLNFDYSEPRSEKQYDSYGRLSKVSSPYTGTSASYWNVYQYDSYDRPTSINEASGRTTSYSYSGNSVTTTEDGITSTQTFDNQGNLTSVDDPAGSVIYNLRPDGQPVSIIAPSKIVTSFEYDNYGRRTGITDPSAGTQSYTYDAAGNIATETDANNKTVSYYYDNYYRLIGKVQPEFTTLYGYNSDGLLASESSYNGALITWQYDTYGRLQKEKETGMDGKWLEKTYSYANSYMQSIQYTSQGGNIVTENYIYDAGHLTEIKLNGTTSIWKLTAANVFGQPTGVTTGSFNRTYSYNAYGTPTGRTAGSFHNQTYSFDATKGNLTYRKDNVKNIQENFTYDNLNRLTAYAGKFADYNTKGNIIEKTDVRTFQYITKNKPYALAFVTSPTNLIPPSGQTITYTSFRRPASITEGDYTAAFTYNGNDERVKMEVKKNGAKELTRYYLSDCYEIDDRAVGGTKEKLYLGGDFYTAPAVYVKEGTSSWNIYYICRDYLGSITQITNSSGSLVQELSYDAWGQLRNPANQAVYTPDATPEPFLGRGYTGHEHLPMFGLINMNARLYDPALGRFLSPDPFVQNPLFIQGFNRYSYALNNPLCYIDRDGQFIWVIPVIAALVGAYVGGSMANDSYNPFNWDWSSGTTWRYMGGGALIGAGASIAAMFAAPALGGMVCTAMGISTSGFAGGAVIGAFGGMIGGFINGAGFAALGGGSFKDIMTSAAAGAGWGTLTGAVVGGVVSGAQAYSKGNNFWSGKSIAEGRSAFSFKNTPITTSQPPALEPLPVTVGNVDVPQPTGGDIYPPNNGFDGTPTTKTLQVGDVIDRYGGTSDMSRFVSPEGTPISARSLPQNTNLNAYDKFQVAKPFPVQSGTASPWFGQPGGGVQYKTLIPIKELVRTGYLK